MGWEKITEIIESGFPFQSPAMKRLMDSLPSIAESNANVLILGESGTGKEIVAKLLHRLGPRSQKSFVAINCAAVPEALLESELFGHEKGSFTGAHAHHRGFFQQAEGGTIFLDEIGDMPLQLQAKLLRVLQDKKVTPVGCSNPKKVDFRLISATHQDLKQLTRQGKFRLDLFYRLEVVPIQIPPLRERVEDIPWLIETFLKAYGLREGKEPPTIDDDAISMLTARRWEGNVRELENFIERLMITHGHLKRISSDDLPKAAQSCPHTEFSLPLDLVPLHELVDRYIMHVFKEVEFHQGRASEILGISRRTIYRKVKALDGKRFH